MRLKALDQQVIVITGASSGIGLATAKMAAERGASVVLCSRNGTELAKIVQALDVGRRALAVECDVADPEAVQRVADRALAEFGRIDSWINNAGVSIYGRLWEVPLDEKRRLFEVNFWGVVHGCRSAVKAMKDGGGAIINIGSALSDRAITLQGMYSASKHAVKGYTDSLRMEIEAEGWPISVSLIKPAAIDTPYPDHAVNRMDHHPVHTAPVYAPEIVADAILACAVSSRRDVYVGGAAKMYSLMETFMPRIVDMFMEKGALESAQSSAKLDAVLQEPSIYGVPRSEGRVRGNYPGHVRKTSLYTQAALHPGVAILTAGSLGLAAAAGIALWQARRKQAFTYVAASERPPAISTTDQLALTGQTPRFDPPLVAH